MLSKLLFNLAVGGACISFGLLLGFGAAEFMFYIQETRKIRAKIQALEKRLGM